MMLLLALLGGAFAATSAWVEVRLPGEMPSKLWFQAPGAEAQPPRPVVFHDEEGRRHDLLVQLEPSSAGLLVDISVRAMLPGEPVRMFRGEEGVVLTPGEERVLELSLLEVATPGTHQKEGARIRSERRRARERERDLARDKVDEPVALVLAVGVEAYDARDFTGSVARSLFAWPGTVPYSMGFPARGMRALDCGEGLKAGVVRDRVRVVFEGAHQPGEVGRLVCEEAGVDEAPRTVEVPLRFF